MCEAQGEAVLAMAVDRARVAWQERLVAAYALGSLAHGGFSAASDVDLALVLADPLGAEDSRAVTLLARSVEASGLPFADRLSVFWGSVASLSGRAAGGRFPPLDRLDLIRYGRLLAGSDVRSRLAPPSQEALVVAAAEFALGRLGTDEAIATLKDAAQVLGKDRKTLTKLILFPVRFLYTARTGEVGRNEAAVAHFAQAAASRAAARLAAMALAWRNADPDADAAAAIASGVRPLYDEFLLDHERRLRAYGRDDLAGAFAQWRTKMRA